jgi:hypothetical protein
MKDSGEGKHSKGTEAVDLAVYFERRNGQIHDSVTTCGLAGWSQT